MKSQCSWNNSSSYDFATTPTLQKNQRSTWSQLKDLWQSTLNYFSASTEPRVWQTEDSAGIAWSAYDPITKQWIERVSAQELRVWLEERHYQNA